MWVLSRENLIWLDVNVKGANQLAHPCSLTYAFIIHSLETIYFNYSTTLLVSVVSTLSLKTKKTGFLASWPTPIFIVLIIRHTKIRMYI